MLDEHRDLRRERRCRDGAERDRDDLCRQDEIGAHRAFDLLALERDDVDRRIGHRVRELRMVRVVFGLAVHEAVCELFEAFVAQVRAADHQQRHHGPRRKRADRERRRHEDRLVDRRAFGHRPHDRQLAVRADARHLLRIERQIIAQHAGGLLRRDLREQRHVVEHGCDVVDQRKEAAGGHWEGRYLVVVPGIVAAAPPDDDRANLHRAADDAGGVEQYCVADGLRVQCRSHGNTAGRAYSRPTTARAYR